MISLKPQSPRRAGLFSAGGGGGVTLHPPAPAALPLHEIFIKTHGNFQPVIICPPSASRPAPGERSTYADQAPRINILQAADICPDILNH